MSNLVNKIRAARNICLVALVLCTGNVLFAQTTQTTQTVAIINPTGGGALDFASGIALHIGADGAFQMLANGNGQIWPSNKLPSTTVPANVLDENMGSHAVSLRLVAPGETRTYGRRLYSPAQPMTRVSQSGVTGTGAPLNPYQVVTTLSPSAVADSAIRVVITDSYVYPELKFTRKFEVTGLDSADSAKLYWSFDAAAGGADQGVGYVDTAAGVLGATSMYSPEKLQFVYNSAFPAWDRYHSRNYITAESEIPSIGDLTNEVTLTRHDTGLAAQWNIPASSTSYTTEIDLEYMPANVLATEKYTPSTVLVGGVSQMEILLSAIGQSASTANFTYDLPTGYRIAATPNLVSTCDAGGTVNATANSSSIEVTTLPIPGASIALPYTCKMTLNVEALTVGEHWADFTSTNVYHSKSYADRVKLRVVTDFGIIKEVFSPALALPNQTSYLTITLENRSTSAQTGLDFTYRSPPQNPQTSMSADFLDVTSSIVASTCGSPSINIATNYEREISLGNVSIPAGSLSSPAQCQITLATKGPKADTYFLYYGPSTSGVEREVYGNLFLTVIAPVDVTARFVPAFITHPSSSRFEMILTHRDTSPFVSASGFSYYMPTNVVDIAAVPNISNTCLPSGSTVTFDTTYPGYVFINVTNLKLKAASTTQPYTCTIAFDMQSISALSDVAWFVQKDPLISGNYAEIYTTGNTGLSVVSALSKNNIVPGEIVTVNMELTSSTAQSGLKINYFFDDTGYGSKGSNIELISNSFTTTCPTTDMASAESPTSVGKVFTNISINANTSCQISFQITSQIPGLYQNSFGPTGSGWNMVLGYYQPLYVFGGVPLPPLPPQNGSVAAIPVASPYALLLTALSLLLATGAVMQGRRMQKPR